jgi:hypothetical protein
LSAPLEHYLKLLRTESESLEKEIDRLNQSSPLTPVMRDINKLKSLPEYSQKDLPVYLKRAEFIKLFLQDRQYQLDEFKKLMREIGLNENKAESITYQEFKKAYDKHAQALTTRPIGPSNVQFTEQFLLLTELINSGKLEALIYARDAMPEFQLQLNRVMKRMEVIDDELDVYQEKLNILKNFQEISNIKGTKIPQSQNEVETLKKEIDVLALQNENLQKEYDLLLSRIEWLKKVDT